MWTTDRGSITNSLMANVATARWIPRVATRNASRGMHFARVHKWRPHMEVRSQAFDPSGSIPVTYSKDGNEISPPVEWSDVPKRARELALTFENTTEPFVQWVVYKIPAELDGLPAGFRHQAEPDKPVHVLQGTNSQGNVGYDGPLGAEGRKYRYALHLYALDESLDLPPKLDKPKLLDAIKGHVLDEATLDAVYERPRG